MIIVEINIYKKGYLDVKHKAEVVRMCSVKKVPLKILQNSQAPLAEFFLNEVAVWDLKLD